MHLSPGVCHCYELLLSLIVLSTAKQQTNILSFINCVRSILAPIAQLTGCNRCTYFTTHHADLIELTLLTNKDFHFKIGSMLISRKSESAKSVQVQVKMLCTWQLLWLTAKKNLDLHRTNRLSPFLHKRAQKMFLSSCRSTIFWHLRQFAVQNLDGGLVVRETCCSELTNEWLWLESQISTEQLEVPLDPLSKTSSQQKLKYSTFKVQIG